MAIELRPQTIKFFEKKGLQFFEEFRAVDKHKMPITVNIPEPDTFTSIRALNEYGEDVGHYDILFKKENSVLEGTQLLVDDEGKQIGEILSLSSLIEFSKNNLNHFNLYSLAESLPFHLRLGFLINNDNPKFILEGLQQVMKTKLPHMEDFKYDAKFAHTKVSQTDEKSPEGISFMKQGCKVISNYIKYLSRNHIKKGMPEFDTGTNVTLSDWELKTNKEFLDELLKKHNIDYNF